MSNEFLPNRFARLIPVDQVEAATGDPLPVVLGESGVQLIRREFSDGHVEAALRVPVRLLASDDPAHALPAQPEHAAE